MSGIVDWGYYSSLYEVDDLQESFDTLELRAEKEVCRVIGPIRWASITEDTFGYEQMKECICHVMHKLFENETSGVGKGLASASNNGYSESYVIQTETQVREELQCLIKNWLSGTGLVGAY